VSFPDPGLREACAEAGPNVRSHSEGEAFGSSLIPKPSSPLPAVST